MLPASGLGRFSESEEVSFVMPKIRLVHLFTDAVSPTRDGIRLDDLFALGGIAVPERLESRKLAVRAKEWYSTKVSARIAVAISSKKAVFSCFVLPFSFFIVQNLTLFVGAWQPSSGG